MRQEHPRTEDQASRTRQDTKHNRILFFATTAACGVLASIDYTTREKNEISRTHTHPRGCRSSFNKKLVKVQVIVGGVGAEGGGSLSCNGLLY